MVTQLSPARVKKPSDNEKNMKRQFAPWLQANSIFYVTIAQGFISKEHNLSCLLLTLYSPL